MKTVVLIALLISVYLTATSLVQGQKLELVVQTGHSGSVTSVAFSPDGRMIASCGSEGTVKLWDVETGLQIRELSTTRSVYFQPADFTRFNSIGNRISNGKPVRAKWHLVNELFYPRNSVARYLWERLTPHTRSLLAKHHDHPTIELLKALTQELNQALKDPALYQAERFKSVRLSAETQALVEKNPTGEELVKLNGSLLKDAFP